MPIIPLIHPIALGAPLSPLDVLHMIIDQIKSLGTVKIDDELLAHIERKPMFRIGNEFNSGMQRSTEYYNQEIKKPDSPLQKAMAILMLYFMEKQLWEQKLAELQEQLLINYQQALAYSSTLDNENQTKQNNMANQRRLDDEKELSDLKKMLDKYVQDMQSYAAKGFELQNRLQGIEEKLQNIENRETEIYKENTQKISEIHEAAHTQVIQNIQSEVQRLDETLVSLNDQLAAAQNELQSSSERAVPSDPFIAEQTEKVTVLQSNIEGIGRIKETMQNFLLKDKADKIERARELQIALSGLNPAQQAKKENEFILSSTQKDVAKVSDIKQLIQDMSKDNPHLSKLLPTGINIVDHPSENKNLIAALLAKRNNGLMQTSEDKNKLLLEKNITLKDIQENDRNKKRIDSQRDRIETEVDRISTRLGSQLTSNSINPDKPKNGKIRAQQYMSQVDPSLNSALSPSPSNSPDQSSSPNFKSH